MCLGGQKQMSEQCPLASKGQTSGFPLPFIIDERKQVTDLQKVQEQKNEVCPMGRQHQLAFDNGESFRAKNVLELVHADICGPMRTTSVSSARYFLLLVDDYSMEDWVYFLKQKSDVNVECKTFKSMVEKNSGEFENSPN